MHAAGLRQSVGSERGAILIHVGIALVVLVGFSAFVADYGVFWVARRQAQNAADAGALAGAIAWVFDEQTSSSMEDSARDAATSNAMIFDAPGTVDVASNPCPGWVTTPVPCVDVRVYRDSSHGNALPTYFANLFGLTSQNVQAMALAQGSAVNGVKCLKPWMAPNGYDHTNIGALLTFEPPLFWVADFPATSGCGAAVVATSDSGGNGDAVTANATFTIDPAVVTLIVDQDPGASWNGNRIVGSCAPSCNSTCTGPCANGLYGRISPRVVPIGLFDAAALGPAAAGSSLPILDFAGLFVLSPSDPLCPTTAAVCGYLVAFPGVLARRPVVSSAALNLAPNLIQ
jgi:hypothetical protein